MELVTEAITTAKRYASVGKQVSGFRFQVSGVRFQKRESENNSERLLSGFSEYRNLKPSCLIESQKEN